MNWDVAHQVAAIAAVQAHRDLGAPRTRYVDVYAALRASGVVGIARPMPRLFGVYLAERDDGPGVLLNATLDIVTQRHTAAHELGHHRLGHGTAYDQELDRASRWGDGSWPAEEKTAEAFAAWFLMPPPAVVAALEHIGVARPRTPEHAYQVARWLGTSYAGTVRHLHRLRLVTREKAMSWLKVQPATLKSTLAGAPVSAKAHVHVIGRGAHGATVHADASDLIVLRLPGAQFNGLPAALIPTEVQVLDGQLSWDHPGESVDAIEVTDTLQGAVSLSVSAPGGADIIQLTVARQAPRAGVEDVWPT